MLVITNNVTILPFHLPKCIWSSKYIQTKFHAYATCYLRKHLRLQTKLKILAISKMRYLFLRLLISQWSVKINERKQVEIKQAMYKSDKSKTTRVSKFGRYTA